MLITNKALKFKRGIKKRLSSNTAIKIKVFVENNYPEDEKMLKRMVRQIMCAIRLEVYDNGVVKTYFCREKTCLVCNSIRLAKFLDKNLEPVSSAGFRYHMVLTVKNPGAEDLKPTIDKMFGFFQNSSLKKDKEYKELNKEVKFIRSFEATLKPETRTFHIHFHILLAGNVEENLIRYGKLIIKYWLKYFGEEKTNEEAQYLAPQEKSLLENFKYLFKINDISESNIKMVYELLKATEGRRLFTAKNIPKAKDDDEEIEEPKFNDVQNANLIDTFLYKKEHENWINTDTGEIFVNDEDKEKYLEELEEKKKKYFNK